MGHDWPTTGQRYRLQSRGTGYELGVHGPHAAGWDEGSPHIAARPAGEGAVWLFENAPNGFWFTTEALMPWPGIAPDPTTWPSSAQTHPVPTPARLDSNDNRQVYAHGPNDGPNQMWSLRADGEGYWYLVNVATGLALDGTNDIYTLDLNDGHHQRWHFLHVG